MREASLILAEQQQTIQKLSEENKKQSLEIDYLKERLDLLLAQLYGKKSEKSTKHPDIPGQLSYLEELEEKPSDEIPEPKPVTVKPHNRKKRGRKPLPDDLPRVDIIHDISDEQKQCNCGSPLDWIGEEVSEQLDFIPAQLRVLRHIRPKYACRSCEGVETEGKTVKIAPPPVKLLPKSIASPGLLAQIVTAKFVDALPFYRQEKQFNRLGYNLSRSNMVNWTIQLGKLLEKLTGFLLQEVLSGPLIHMDETTLQVLKEKGKAASTKSYMWVMRTGASEKPAVYFQYDSTRARAVARKLLSSYKGIVQTDGYSSYDFIDSSPDMEHAGCWAHSRRKFNEVIKALNKNRKKKAKNGHAEKALQFIGQLYHIEREANELEKKDQERTAHRQKYAKPVLDEFLQWLEELEPQTPPQGLLGKAVSYTLKQWPKLKLFVENGYIPLGRVNDWRGCSRERLNYPPIPFPVAARRTGRADFPHPALIQNNKPSLSAGHFFDTVIERGRVRDTRPHLGIDGTLSTSICVS